jgi:deazaflavin-dependent oxidoreductase (nitroreductase family)
VFLDRIIMANNYSLMRTGFRILNRFLMVPAFRLGLGPILGSPYGGYIMVIKTHGHLTGKTRYTPVNYAIANGSVYCTAGFGKISHWFKNISAHPQVKLILPARRISSSAEIVKDGSEKIDALRRVMINSGFAAFVFGGINPYRLSAQKLEELTRDYVVLRFRCPGLVPGPFDPGGWFWLLPTFTLIALVIWIIL